MPDQDDVIPTAQSSARGGHFLTEPRDRGAEPRCYLRDPDGCLIETGQTTGLLANRRM
jgi:hypothetical protein